jgi:integrase
VKDIDFHNSSLMVYDGKGGKDRVTLLPASLYQGLKQQIAQCIEVQKNKITSKGLGHRCRMPSASLHGCFGSG